MEDRVLECRKEILKQARKFQVDPFLVEAILWKESDYDPFAFRYEPVFFRKYCESLSRRQLEDFNPCVGVLCSFETERILLACSIGAMQVMGLKAREMGYKAKSLTNLFILPFNIEIGTSLIKRLLDRYNGNIEKTISAYNAGSATEKNHEKYVLPVLKKYKLLKEENHATS